MLHTTYQPNSSEAFYAQLEPIVSLGDLTESSYYRSAPEDWFVFITDVRGSTAAVAAGRYKEVNTLGAASILCAQNACPGVDFPFVFGGDGATLIVPPSGREAVTASLTALARKSLLEFGLELQTKLEQ